MVTTIIVGAVCLVVGFMFGTGHGQPNGHDGEKHGPCIAADEFKVGIEEMGNGFKAKIAALEQALAIERAKLHQKPPINCCHCVAPHCLAA